MRKNLARQRFRPAVFLPLRAPRRVKFSVFEKSNLIGENAPIPAGGEVPNPAHPIRYRREIANICPLAVAPPITIASRMDPRRSIRIFGRRLDGAFGVGRQWHDTEGVSFAQKQLSFGVTTPEALVPASRQRHDPTAVRAESHEPNTVEANQTILRAQPEIPVTGLADVED